MSTATYVTLSPIIYIEDGHVREITRAGVQIHLDDAQAAALEGSISFVRSDGIQTENLPRTVILRYDGLSVFPAAGNVGYEYLAADTGLLYSWSGAHYETVSQDNITSIVINDSTSTGRALITAVDPAAARTAIGAVTSADITAARDALVNSAPGQLDTLKELADALGDDANYATTVTAALASKLSASAVVDNTDGTVSVGSVLAMEPLTPAAAIVTASTAPAIGKITLYNASGGNLAPALPALSGIAAGRRLAVRRDPADTSPNTVTFTLPGGDTFYSSGATSFTLPLAGEQREFQVISVSATKYWAPAGSLNPVGALDNRYLGTVKAGVKGGKTTILRRRDVARADRLSPWYGQITATIAAGSSSTISSAQSYAMSATPTWCTPVNGAQFTANPLSSTSFMLNWRSANGGIVGATTYPWPTATGIEFELDTASTQAFELWFRCASPSATTFFYDLWIDGLRVWDIPQTTSITANTSTLAKFSGLPTGVHRYRVVMNNCSIHTLFTPQYTIPVKAPSRGPRIFFLGDSLMSVGANSGTSGMHTGIELGAWPWRFAEMVGCDDLWQGGVGSTGFIATAGGRRVTDGAITSGSNILTSATAAFVSGDAGAAPANIVQVIGAGVSGGVLSALITSVTDGTHVVLDTTASTTVSGAWTRIGGSSANFPIRAITDVVPAAPDIVIMGGWHNDAGSGATAIADAYDRTIATIQASLPNTMIIPFGAWDSVGTAGATYTTIDAAVLAVCTARGVPYIETGNNGNVYDGAGNIVATQGKWIDTNTKNLYTCSDNTHETDAGMTYIAHRMCQAIHALLPA